MHRDLKIEDFQVAYPIAFGSESDYFVDIDRLLGPCETRYFGSGFRRVRYHATPVDNASHSWPISGTLDVRYPANWSTKSTGTALPAHLSTIDAVYLGTTISEWGVHRLFGCEKSDAEPLVTHCAIRSGAAPDEQLTALPYSIDSALTTSIKDRRSPFTLSTALSLRLGAMKLEINVAHRGQLRKDLTASEPTNPLHVCGQQSLACRHATLGETSIHLRNVVLDREGRHASAEVFFGPSIPAYRLLSLVEFSVACAQMAQAVIYRTDKLDRAQSNTLWMRDFVIDTTAPCKVSQQQLIELRTLTHKRQRVNGELWSVFRFLCQLGAMTATFTFAHKLEPVAGDMQKERQD